MTFTTYYIADGKWSGERIEAICWADAEYKASFLGLTVEGRLVAEIDSVTGKRIDYDYQNN